MFAVVYFITSNDQKGVRLIERLPPLQAPLYVCGVCMNNKNSVLYSSIPHSSRVSNKTEVTKKHNEVKIEEKKKLAGIADKSLKIRIRSGIVSPNHYIVHSL